MHFENTLNNSFQLNDERVPMEICMLARCARLPGVVRLLDWYSMPEGFLIVMERPYPCVDMFDFIRAQKKLEEDVSFSFDCVRQTILAQELRFSLFNKCTFKKKLYFLFFIFGYLGEIFKILIQKAVLQLARFLFRQVAQTIHDCARRKVLHRDIKVS